MIITLRKTATRVVAVGAVTTLMTLLMAPSPAQAAARSVGMTISNETDCRLIRVDYGLDGGEWNAVPTERIHARTAGWSSAESNGIFTGTEGWFNYVTLCPGVGDDQSIAFRFNNPYVGSNSYMLHTAGTSFGASYYSGGGGDNASVTYHIRLS